jgi:methionyl-tRNA synthetase
MVPPNEKNSPENSMIHSDLVFSKAMRRVETTSNFKSIFPESHTFAKLSLLTQIRERQDGTFSFTDFQNLVGEELDYLEQNEVNSITKRILKICEEIKIVEKMDTNNTSESFYKIISRGKKADTREAEIKKKWINFAIRKDMEQEIDDKIQGLQKTFSIKRSKTKGIDEY